MVELATNEIRRVICRGVRDRQLSDEQPLTAGEVAELAQRLEEILLIELGMRGPSTFGELLEEAQRLALFQGMADGFAHRCELTVPIRCPVERAYEGLCDVRRWPSIQSHVQAIDVIHDDGRLQELYMQTTVNGVAMRLRTIRRCEPYVGTRFFQLVAPPAVKHHAGAYELRRRGPDGCEVTAHQFWNMLDESQSAKIEEVFREYARLSLGNWKRHLEGGAR